MAANLHAQWALGLALSKRGGHKGPSGGYKGPKPALSKIYKLGSTNLYLTYGGRLLSTLTCGPYGPHSARPSRDGAS